MIQLENLERLEAKDIMKLTEIIRPELTRRGNLYQRYVRKYNDVELIGNNKDVTVPFERYIVNIASGYLGGKQPTYEVEELRNSKDKNLIQKLLGKVIGQENYTDEMSAIIDYITRYNDDGTEHYNLVKDIMIYGACYEIEYENEDNEKVYARLDPLQTVAIWDYSIPKKLVGVVNYHEEKDLNGKITNVVELTDRDGTRVFKAFGQGGTYEEQQEEYRENVGWDDVPMIAVELPDNTSLFEPVIDIIDAYQELIKDTKETFSYNNDAKLKITGYRPEEPLMVENEKGEYIENERRKKEDETLLNMKVFYTPEDGDIAWVEKHIEDSAIQNTLKTYIDLIMMNTGVPQTTDLGFTKADNASAIDRKFFSLEQMTVEAMNLLKQAYLRRWELIFGRINLAKNTSYDFRDVKITLPKNLPANENEMVDMYMKLRGLVSDETIIERLPLNFDSVSEIKKKDEQDAQDLDKEIEKASRFNEVNGNEQKDKPKTDVNDDEK